MEPPAATTADVEAARLARKDSTRLKLDHGKGKFL